jgi:hypothetical protein
MLFNSDLQTFAYFLLVQNTVRFVPVIQTAKFIPDLHNLLVEENNLHLQLENDVQPYKRQLKTSVTHDWISCKINIGRYLRPFPKKILKKLSVEKKFVLITPHGPKDHNCKTQQQHDQIANSVGFRWSFQDGGFYLGACTVERPSKLLKLVLKILDVVSAEEHCRVQNLHNKKEILNCSIIVYSTYVKSQGRRAGVPDHQILIKFKNHVAQLQSVEKKLKQQTQNTNNFCDFVVSEFQKNLHNNAAFISILWNYEITKDNANLENLPL